MTVCVPTQSEFAATIPESRDASGDASRDLEEP